MRYRIKDCFNTEDFRKLAKKKLPFPVFHYIDGAADDEVTLKRSRLCWTIYISQIKY